MPPASVLRGLPTFSLSNPMLANAARTTSSVTPILATPVLSAIAPDKTVPRSLSLPSKLVKKIVDLEFIDMAELVPDSWRYQEEEPNKCCHQPKCHRRGPVTDILLWIECYSTLIEVLGSSYPSKTPEFMAYLKTIVRAHRSFTGEGWVTYDTCYRRKAAAVKTLDWGQVDFTLYNETFTGRAKEVNRCKFCSSEYHSSVDCVFAPEVKKKSMPPHTRYEANRPANYACHLFNNKEGNRCRFSPCKFVHSCSECRGPHPASQCRYNRPPPSKVPRVESARK